MNLIKELRETTGLNQTELSRQSGFSRKKLYNLENDLVEFKKEDSEKLAEIFAKRIDLSYVAGLFDRSSHINITKIAPYKIHKNQHSPMYISRIQFMSKHKLLCDIIMKVFQTGRVCRGGNDSKYWLYYAHCESVDNVIDALLPYIRLKRQKLLILKEFRSYLEHTRDLYRHTGMLAGSGWIDIAQQKTAGKWLKVSELMDLLGLKRGIITKYCQEGRLIARKVKGSGKNSQWEIAPIINLEECREMIGEVRHGNPYPPEVIDNYDDLMARLKEAP